MTEEGGSYRVVVGGVLWHGSLAVNIEDHGYKNFVFPNHENKRPVVTPERVFEPGFEQS